MRKILLFSATCALFSTPTSLIALPSYNPQNSHYYEFVAQQEGINWTDALNAANNRSFRGFPGYLATATSSSENTFIADLAPPHLRTSWLGGTDMGSEGNWIWADGPELGRQVTYANWAASEPNNVLHSAAGEDYLHFWPDGTWNDLPSSWQLQGYFVEYSQPIPEPGSAIALLAFGFLATLKHIFKTPSVQRRDTLEGGRE